MDAPRVDFTRVLSLMRCGSGSILVKIAEQSKLMIIPSGLDTHYLRNMEPPWAIRPRCLFRDITQEGLVWVLDIDARACNIWLLLIQSAARRRTYKRLGVVRKVETDVVLGLLDSHDPNGTKDRALLHSRMTCRKT